MKTKTIHHLDEDFNIVFDEIHYTSKGFLFKIEIIDLDGSKEIFDNEPKLFDCKKAIKEDNYRFRNEVKAKVKQNRIKNYDKALKVISALSSEVKKRPVVTDSVVDVLLKNLNSIMTPQAQSYNRDSQSNLIVHNVQQNLNLLHNFLEGCKQNGIALPVGIVARLHQTFFDQVRLQMNTSEKTNQDEKWYLDY